MQRCLSDYGGVRETSRGSLKVLVESGKLSDRYMEYIEILRGMHGPSSDREVCFRSGHADPNYFRPRRNELVKMGLIVDAGVRLCSVSHRMVHVWWFADENVMLF